MNYSLGHYLRNFPLRYYMSGGLASGEAPDVFFYLSADAASVLVVRRRRAIAYEDKIGEVAGHPPLPGAPRAPSAISRAFTAKLFGRNRLHGSPKITLVPDFSVEDLYCNIHNTKNLRDYSTDGLLESLHEEPRQVIGVWDDTREFRWSVLSADLQEVSGRIDREHRSLMILGIPREYCEECESWAEAQKGSLLGIIPAPVACLRWFIEKIPLGQRTRFLVLILNQAIIVAAVQDQSVTLIRQYENDIDFVEKELTALAAELDTDQQPYICVWSAVESPKLPAFRLHGLALDAEALEKIHGSEMTIRSANGTRQELKDARAHVLMWLESKMI
ncbi:MAG TPA: hypothetical protein VHS80_06575 [Chthoniobacterales bacterium]|nr:hypothetical protein [Chthoniobacterales bacterium]